MSEKSAKPWSCYVPVQALTRWTYHPIWDVWSNYWTVFLYYSFCIRKLNVCVTLYSGYRPPEILLLLQIQSKRPKRCSVSKRWSDLSYIVQFRKFAQQCPTASGSATRLQFATLNQLRWNSRTCGRYRGVVNLCIDMSSSHYVLTDLAYRPPEVRQLTSANKKQSLHSSSV